MLNHHFSSFSPQERFAVYLAILGLAFIIFIVSLILGFNIYQNLQISKAITRSSPPAPANGDNYPGVLLLPDNASATNASPVLPPAN